MRLKKSQVELIEPSKEDMQQAASILLDLLKQNGGVVSTKVLIKKLEQKKFQSAKVIVGMLKFPEENDIDLKGASHEGRSFYSANALNAEQKAQQAEVKDEDVPDDEDEEDTVEKKTNKKEEAFLVRYVTRAIETIYDTSYGPEAEIAFDVHNNRAGKSYENVDVIGIHWRTDKIIETVAIEAKLTFTSKLVQQARNYTRFADRVWIAVPVKSIPEEAAAALREDNDLVFDYAVDSGIGILGCKKVQGKGYLVFPIHWPVLNHPGAMEKNAFLIRHKQEFVKAKVIDSEDKGSYGKLST